LASGNEELIRFTRALIELRHNQPALRRRNYLTGKPMGEAEFPDVAWFGPNGTAVDWHGPDLPIICVLGTHVTDFDPLNQGRDLLVFFNSSDQATQFAIPSVCKTRIWNLFCDTSSESPNDVFPGLDGPTLPDSVTRRLPERSLAIYVSSRGPAKPQRKKR
jgi:glycogen operon protein